MIAEMRLQRLEFDNRRHFTPEKQLIEDSRALIEELTAPPKPFDLELVTSRSATNMRMAADNDVFEVG